MWAIALLGIMIFGVAALLGYETELRTLKSGNVPPAIETARGAFNLARSALKNDGDWNDCSGADQNCSLADSNGLFPLYSPSLGKTLENVPTPQGFRYTVKIKPISSNEAYVVVHVKGKGIDLYQGAKFTRTTGKAKLPIVYGASSKVSLGSLCSYYWDGKKIVGETNPNFTVYLDSNFSWSPEIEIPKNPAGNNPKDVEFVTDFSTTVSGYQNIDKVYTTGDLYIQDGAHLGLAYANGSVYMDSTSSADVVVQNGDLVYPSFNDNLQDLNLTVPPIAGGDYFSCYRGTKTIMGVNYYRYFYVGRYCTVNFENATVYIQSAYISGKINNIDNSQLYVGNFYLYSTNSINVTDSEINVKSWSNYQTINLYWNGDSQLNLVDGYISGDINVYPTSLFHLKGDEIDFSITDFNCANPQYCLIDANTVDARISNIIGATVIARKELYSAISNFVGNVFGEYIDASITTFCNIVDSEGNQIIADRNYFYNLIAPDGIDLPAGAVGEVAKVVCSNESDCLLQLSQ